MNEFLICTWSIYPVYMNATKPAQTWLAKMINGSQKVSRIRKLLPPADYTYSYAESVDRDYNHNDLVHKRKNRDVVHDKTTKTRTSVSREDGRNDR